VVSNQEVKGAILGSEDAGCN